MTQTTKPHPPKPRGMGSRIRTRLQVLDLIVPKAAAACGLPVPTLEMYLYDKSLPGAASLMGLATGLRCSANWLLGVGQ